MNLLQTLKENYRYSDYYLPDERYEKHLYKLRTEPLTQELVDYLCSQIDNPKSKKDCNLRFIHLQPLFLNPTTQSFDLKRYIYEHIVKTRRLWLKLFYIRTYALFANEQELIPIMQKFETLLKKSHDSEDYEQILSDGGLPFLCNNYGYDCFFKALETAKEEYLKIDPLLRGHFTLNENGDFVEILSSIEIHKRYEAWLKKKGLQ